MLVVGLGNPGTKYEATRHNVGFLILDKLTQDWKANKKANAMTSTINTKEAQVILCKPQTFMNKSGESVRALADYFDIDTGAVIVVHDDADLPFAERRTKLGGGSAGHNGIKSIVHHLGTEAFWRLRVGIGRPQNPNLPLDKYVLESWSREQKQLLDTLVSEAASEVEELIVEVSSGRRK